MVLDEKTQKIIDEAFEPYLKNLMYDRKLIEEYYDSRLSISKFCVKKNIPYWPFYVLLIRKYGLPARLSRN